MEKLFVKEVCGCTVYLCEGGRYELWCGGRLLEVSDDLAHIDGYARWVAFEQ